MAPKRISDNCNVVIESLYPGYFKDIFSIFVFKAFIIPNKQTINGKIYNKHILNELGNVVKTNTILRITEIYGINKKYIQDKRQKLYKYKNKIYLKLSYLIIS